MTYTAVQAAQLAEASKRGPGGGYEALEKEFLGETPIPPKEVKEEKKKIEVAKAPYVPPYEITYEYPTGEKGTVEVQPGEPIPIIPTRVVTVGVGGLSGLVGEEKAAEAIKVAGEGYKVGLGKTYEEDVARVVEGKIGSVVAHPETHEVRIVSQKEAAKLYGEGWKSATEKQAAGYLEWVGKIEKSGAFPSLTKEAFVTKGMEEFKPEWDVTVSAQVQVPFIPSVELAPFVKGGKVDVTGALGAKISETYLKSVVGSGKVEEAKMAMITPSPVSVSSVSVPPKAFTQALTTLSDAGLLDSAGNIRDIIEVVEKYDAGKAYDLLKAVGVKDVASKVNEASSYIADKKVFESRNIQDPQTGKWYAKSDIEKMHSNPKVALELFKVGGYENILGQRADVERRRSVFAAADIATSAAAAAAMERLSMSPIALVTSEKFPGFKDPSIGVGEIRPLALKEPSGFLQKLWWKITPQREELGESFGQRVGLGWRGATPWVEDKEETFGGFVGEKGAGLGQLMVTPLAERGLPTTLQGKLWKGVVSGWSEEYQKKEVPSIQEIITSPEAQLAMAPFMVAGAPRVVGAVAGLVGKYLGWTPKALQGTSWVSRGGTAAFQATKIPLLTTTAAAPAVMGGGLITPPPEKSWEEVMEQSYREYLVSPAYLEEVKKIEVQGKEVVPPTFEAFSKEFTKVVPKPMEYEGGIKGVFGRGTQRFISEPIERISKGPSIPGGEVVGALAGGAAQVLFPYGVAAQLYPEKGPIAFTTMAPYYGPITGATALTWKEQPLSGKAMGVGFTLMPAVGGVAYTPMRSFVAGKLGKVMPYTMGEVVEGLKPFGRVKLSTEAGEVTVWTGLKLGDKPVFGWGKGVGLRFGRPKGLDLPKAVEVTSGYEPVTGIETRIIVDTANLKKMGFSDLEIVKLTETLKVRSEIPGKVSPYSEGTVEITPTKTLSKEGVELVYMELKKAGGGKVDQIYGSYTAKPQLKPVEQVEWVEGGKRGLPGDLDVQLRLGEEGTQKFAQSLMDKLKVVEPEKRFKISPNSPSLIQVSSDGKTWSHAVDIHAGGSAYGMGIGEAAYGMVHAEPSVTLKYEGVGKLKAMGLSEFVKRKAASILGWQKGEISPAPHRVKDIYDFYVGGKSFLGEAALADWAKVWKPLEVVVKPGGIPTKVGKIPAPFGEVPTRVRVEVPGYTPTSPLISSFPGVSPLGVPSLGVTPSLGLGVVPPLTSGVLPSIPSSPISYEIAPKSPSFIFGDIPGPSLGFPSPLIQPPSFGIYVPSLGITPRTPHTPHIPRAPFLLEVTFPKVLPSGALPSTPSPPYPLPSPVTPTPSTPTPFTPSPSPYPKASPISYKILPEVPSEVPSESPSSIFGVTSGPSLGFPFSSSVLISPSYPSIGSSVYVPSSPSPSMPSPSYEASSPSRSPFSPYWLPSPSIRGIGGGLGSLFRKFGRSGPVGKWVAPGMMVIGPHPLYGEVAGGKVGAFERKYGAVTPRKKKVGTLGEGRIDGGTFGSAGRAYVPSVGA